MKRILAIITLLIVSFYMKAQDPVTVQILVQPPYSSHIEDYTSYENKLVLILSGQANSNMQPYQVYFKGFLQGDNGVRVETDENYKPPVPVEIPAGGSISFNGNELDFFSSEHLTITGTNAKSIILSDGLPEGYYHICIRAFDYDSDQPLSGEEPIGCSPDFGIFHVDPPQIVFPACGENIMATETQNIVFSWTIPVNSPVNTQYTLTLTELQQGQDPNDAANAMSYPPFFETNTQANSYAYTMADPPLEEGKTYVVQVRAFDPEEKTEYKNNGYSEVCTFTYGNKISIFNGDKINKAGGIFKIDSIKKPDITYTPKYKTTKVCGKIQYNYPDDKKIYPMNLANVKLIVDYTLDPNSNYSSSNNFEIDKAQDYGTGIYSGFVLATTKTAKDGSYCFEFINNIELGNVADYVSGGIRMFSPVPVYRVLRVEIESPQSGFYEKYSYNPEIVTIGQQNNNINFQFNVKSFNLDISLIWNDFWQKMFKTEYLYNNGNLVGVPVYIYRKFTFGSIGTSPFPKDDGLPKEFKNHTVHNDLPSNMILVANTSTDDKGIAKFKNLILNDNPTYQYYIYVAPSVNNINNFKPKGPFLYPLSYELEKKYNGTIKTGNSNPESMTYTIKLDQEFPKITGIIYDEDNNHTPLKNVKLTLDELYFVSKESYLKYKQNPANPFEEKLNQKIINFSSPFFHHVYRFNLWGTGTDGKFEFNNLAILHDKEKIIDNFFGIKVEKQGYELAEQEGKLDSKTFVSKKLLRMGEKMNIVINMRRGAHIKGRVVDAETNQTLEGAIVRMIPDQIAITTGYSGEFSDYPALKLPGKEQLLVIEKANYIPDTFTVIINKSNQDLGTFKIFKLKRRIIVAVRDNTTKKAINGAFVEIKDVSKYNYVLSREMPLTGVTKGIGMVYFSFDNAEENHTVLVSVPNGLKNYEPQSININIPLSKNKTKLIVYLKPATCIKGHIYAGNGNNIPLDNVIVKEKQSSSGSGFLQLLTFGNNDDSTSVTSNSQGYYFKRNVPLGFFQKTFVAAKAQSQYIGDKWKVMLSEPKDTNNCVVHDFHLTIYDDMDITHLLGFPIYITDLKSISHKKAKIKGGFVNINGNGQFSIDKNTTLEFGEIVITAGDIPPGDTIPRSVPEKQRILTDKNKLDISVKDLKAILNDDKGISVSPNASNSLSGEIKGRVKLNNKTFNISNIKLPGIYVTDMSKNTIVTVFSADKSMKEPLGTQKRIAIADKNGKNIKYTLFDFHNVEVITGKSGIEDNSLVLNSILHSDIENMIPKDIKLNIGDVKIGKNNITQIKGSSEIIIMLDKWKLKSKNWIFDTKGFTINEGIIDANGFQLQFNNLRLKENQLDGTLTKFKFNDVRLLGIKKLNIVSDEAGFAFINVHGNDKAFQIDIKKNSQYGYCAYIDHLPGLKQEDKISFPFILLRSDGNSQYPLDTKVIRLYDLVNFRPDANTLLDVTSQLFQIHGNIILHYPKVNTIATNISFQNESGQLRFGLNATSPINFTSNGLETKLNNVKLSYHLLTATGTVVEQGAFPSTKVILTHTPEKIQIDIKENEKIKISDNNYFSNAIGEMHVAGNKWSTFWFEGYPMGMKGISDNNPKKMHFTVNGVVTASGQSIDIKKVDTPFGEMEFSYNLPKSELTGYCKIDKTVGGVGLKGSVETVVGTNGWIFMTTGTVTVPSFGEINLFGLLGDYNGTSSFSQKNSGGFSCLPPAFQNKISGFLISGYFQRNFFDPIDYDFALVSVKAGLDVGLAARFYTSFEDSGPIIGLGLKLYGEAYFDGSLKTTCTSVNVNTEAMIGINSTYNTSTKYFKFNGCAGLSMTIRGEQCLGTAGLCPESACIGVDIGTISLSANITGDSNGDLNYSLQKKYCSDCD